MDINPASHLGDYLGIILHSPWVICLRKGKGLHYSYSYKTSNSNTSALTNMFKPLWEVWASSPLDHLYLSLWNHLSNWYLWGQHHIPCKEIPSFSAKKTPSEGLLKHSFMSISAWCKKVTHWKRTWCWERLKAKEEEGGRGWDG